MNNSLIKNCAKAIRRRNLIVKISLLAIAILVIVFLISRFLVSRYIDQKVTNDLSIMSNKIGYFVENDKRLANASFENFRAYNLNDIGKLFSGDDFLIKQINLLSEDGFYISSSEATNLGKRASKDILTFIKDDKNNFKLLKVTLLDGQLTTKYRQYIYKFDLEGINKPVFLQILYNEHVLAASQKGYILFLLAIIAGIGLVIGLIIWFAYFGLMENLRRLQQRFDKSFKTNKDDIDGEFWNILDNISQQEKEVKNEQAKSVMHQTDKNLGLSEMVKSGRVAPSVRKFNLVLLAIRLTNFRQATSELSGTNFLRVVMKLQQIYHLVAQNDKSVLLKYDSDLAWLGFKGEDKYSNCLATIKRIKTKLSSFKEESGSSIKKEFKPLFLIDKGKIVLANFQNSSGSFNILGGSAHSVSTNLMHTLKEGNMWATSITKNELSQHCHLSRLPKVGNFWPGSPEGLYLINLQGVGIEEEMAGQHNIGVMEVSEKQNKAANKNRDKNKAKDRNKEGLALGMGGLLEDTLKSGGD
ncbi:MAG: hypothetical protein JJV97_03190 [SAR324 cluster bacterium]|nr:hypothetical protein [SAR324 cluster bacterium]